MSAHETPEERINAARGYKAYAPQQIQVLKHNIYPILTNISATSEPSTTRTSHPKPKNTQDKCSRPSTKTKRVKRCTTKARTSTTLPIIAITAARALLMNARRPRKRGLTRRGDIKRTLRDLDQLQWWMRIYIHIYIYIYVCVCRG